MMKPKLIVSRSLYNDDIQLLLGNGQGVVVSIPVGHTEDQDVMIRKEKVLLSVLDEGFDVKVYGGGEKPEGQSVIKQAINLKGRLSKTPYPEGEIRLSFVDIALLENRCVHYNDDMHAFMLCPDKIAAQQMRRDCTK